MNTLYTIIEEYIDLLLSGNVSNWLGLNKRTISSFELFFFSRKIFIKKFSNRDIHTWVAFLIYFSFIKDHRKLFLSKYNMFHCCTLCSFFTKSFGLSLAYLSEKKILLNKEIRNPMVKIFGGIWLNKKIKELENSIQIWKRRFVDCLVVEILNESYFEMVKKNLIETKLRHFFSKKYLWDILQKYNIRKRFNCMFIFLLKLGILFDKSFSFDFYSEKITYASQYKFFNAKIFNNKYLQNCLDAVMFYFFKKNSLSLDKIHSITHFFKYEVASIMKETMETKKTRGKSSQIIENKNFCYCFHFPKLNKKINLIILHPKKNLTFEPSLQDPFRSLL